MRKQSLNPKEQQQSPSFTSENVFSSVSSSPATNDVVSTPESCPGVKKLEESAISYDVDTDFLDWMEGLHDAADQSLS